MPNNVQLYSKLRVCTLSSRTCHFYLESLEYTEHAQSSVFEYCSFFQQNSLKVSQDLHLHQVIGIRPQKPVTY